MNYKSISCIFILFALCFFVTTPGFAVDSYTIKLKKAAMNIQNNDFYIKNVIDGRIDKSNIGIAQIGIFNKKVPVVLGEDFTDAIQSYILFFSKRRFGAVSLRVGALYPVAYETNFMPDVCK